VESISPRKQKRGSYTITSEEDRAKIAKYAIVNGPTNTAKHFSAKLGMKLSESTVRSIRDSYKKKTKSVPEQATQTKLGREKRGPQPMLGSDLDQAVQKRIVKLRDEGVPINRTVLIATGLGMAKKRHANITQDRFTRGWAASLMKRMGFVKRKSTKAARKLPADFEHQKTEFHARIVSAVRDNDIPGKPYYIISSIHLY
jgi:hypothetical protein